MSLSRIRHVIPLLLLLALCAAIVPSQLKSVDAKVAATTSPILILGGGATQTTSAGLYPTYNYVNTGASFQAISVSGSGFVSPYTTPVGPMTFQGTVTSTIPGSFPQTGSGPITVNNGTISNPAYAQVPASTPAGSYTITFSDTAGDPTVTDQVNISSGATGSGACGTNVGGAFLSVAPTSIAPGGSVVFTGSGYQAYQTVTFSNSGPTTTALSNGTISVTYVVPSNDPAGSYAVTAGDGFGHSACTTLVVGAANVGGASLVLSPSSVSAGQSISVSGSGFNTSGTVTISGSGISTTPVSLVSNGTFSSTIPTIATTATGSYIISASDGTHAGVATLSLINATGITALTATPNTITAGSQVMLTGSGFSANTGVLVLVSGTGFVQQTFPQTTGGTFSGTVTIAAGTPAGVYTVTANDGSKNATTTITVGTSTTTGVAVYASPSNATAGQAVVVTGSGFTANATTTITGAGATTTTTSNASGGISVSLTIPTTTAAGSYPVTATDSTGRTGSYTIRVGATGISISAASTSGTPGQGITVTGTGFTAGEQVSVSLANTATPQTAVAGTSQTFTANASGTISGTYIVPSIAAGTYAILALGQTSHVEALSTLALLSAVPTATATPVVVATATAVPTATPAALPAVVSAASTTIFAEGNTGTAAGNTSALPLSDKVTFNEKLYLYNPGSAASAVTTTYYVYPTGATTATTITANDTVAPGATVVRNVNTDVGNDKFVSIVVQSTTGIVAETAISRVRGDGTVLDTDSSLGSSALQQNWYLAEGYTGASLQEYITLFNPGTAAATAQVSYLPSNTPAPAPQSVSVPAKGRVTINVRAVYNKLVVHGSRNVAISVSSTAPIAVDRSMYWGDGAGSAKYGYSLGPAISAGKTSQTFPFVPTEGGSQTFVTVLNPGTSAASTTLTLRSIGGISLATSTFSIPGGQRYTFTVPSILRGDNGAIVGQLVSSQPVVAEAGLYFGGSPNIGRHPGMVVQSSVGAPTGARAMVAAGGAQLRMYNPGNTIERVQVTLSTGGGSSVAYDSTLPSNLARTITLPAGTDPRGILIRASGTVEAVLINGGDGSTTASGGNLN